MLDETERHHATATCDAHLHFAQILVNIREIMRPRDNTRLYDLDYYRRKCSYIGKHCGPKSLKISEENYDADIVVVTRVSLSIFVRLNAPPALHRDGRLNNLYRTFYPILLLGAICRRRDKYREKTLIIQCAIPLKLFVLFARFHAQYFCARYRLFARALSHV